MRLYLDAPKGVIGQDLLGDLMRQVLKYVDDAQVSSDEHGTYIEVPDEVGEKIVGTNQEKPKRKPGRPRKTEE